MRGKHTFGIEKVDDNGERSLPSVSMCWPVSCKLAEVSRHTFVSVKMMYVFQPMRVMRTGAKWQSVRSHIDHIVPQTHSSSQ